MSNSKRTQAGSATVDGAEFTWRFHQQPLNAPADSRRGFVLAIRRVGGDREALVEWPASLRPDDGGAARRPNIDATLLTISVRAALTGGWDPNSRGRPVPVRVSRTEAAAFA